MSSHLYRTKASSKWMARMVLFIITGLSDPHQHFKLQAVIHSECPLNAWASCQIRKIAGCACAGNTGNVFPATAGKRSRHACTGNIYMHQQTKLLLIQIKTVACSASSHYLNKCCIIGNWTLRNFEWKYHNFHTREEICKHRVQYGNPFSLGVLIWLLLHLLHVSMVWPLMLPPRYNNAHFVEN